MLLILFVEICSEMSSKVIFWSNKCILALIWVPSNCTQMSQNPNHYLEPCRKQNMGYFAGWDGNCQILSILAFSRQAENDFLKEDDESNYHTKI